MGRSELDLKTMTMSVPLPIGSYVTADPTASCKRLINIFSEPSPQDSVLTELKGGNPSQESAPAYLRRWAGITPFANDGSGNPTRGLWTMQGILYAVIGPTLYSVSQLGVLTQLGTGIPGSSFVRMTDNTACLVILVPNTTSCYTYCPNVISPTPAFQQLTASLFLSLGAIDCKFLDSYIVFLAIGGRQFYNDDGQVVSGQNQITFTTNATFPREFGTDPFVGIGVEHRTVTPFGQLTSESYINVGNPVGTPFSSAPQTFMEMGCHPLAGYSVNLTDNTLIWVANDKTVRRKNGQIPVRISNSGIESILEHANLQGSYSLTPNIAGHPIWVFVMPAAFRTIAYDCLTTEWFEIESYNLGYWRALCYRNAYGLQFVGDSQGNGIGYLDTSVFTEFNKTMVSTFITQPIYSEHNRIIHRRLELVISTGEGGFSGANLSLYVSDDSANTFRGFPNRNLGPTGNYWVRATWFNLGQARSRVYKFSTSDPTPTFTVQITTDVEPCKW
jgi:hypothetical protein